MNDDSAFLYVIQHNKSTPTTLIFKGFDVELINLNNMGMMMWTKPIATEMRFSFEVTIYVMNKSYSHS